MELLSSSGVVSLAGNSEEYFTLGIEPFYSYFNGLKKASQLWTASKLNEQQIGQIKLFPRFLEILIGGQKVALCHFANDVRFDYSVHSTWTYQDKISNNRPGYTQFLYTNSAKQKREMNAQLEAAGNDAPEMKGILSAKKEPLFYSHKASYYQAVIQGHVHWKLYEESSSTRFYSIRAVGMAYGKDDLNTASYVILKEKLDGGFDLEEVLVSYDREKMIAAILASDSPDHSIEKFTSMTR